MDEPETVPLLPNPVAGGDTASSSGHHHDDDDGETLMCRVCRGDEGDLYYPCLCTGSIKYVHQECLMEWLKYSKKEVCELCNHKYSFEPIYRPDMPKAIPVIEVLKGLGSSVRTFLKTWLIYTMVIVAWLGIVPITAARIFTAVFAGSVNALFVLPFSIFSSDFIMQDIAKGCLLLSVFVCAFISLLWLREQIVHGGPPEWLNLDDDEEEEEEGVEGGENEGEEEEGDGADDGDVEDTDDEVNGNDGDRNHVQEHQQEDQLGDGWNLNEAFNERDADPLIGGDDAEQRRQLRRRDLAAARPAAAAEQQQQQQPQPQPLDARRPDARRAVAIPAAPPLPNGGAGAENAAGVAAGDREDWANNWERLGDELTWQRLLGLDGSFVFIEHVFWVISLNTLFTVLFAWSPYKLGSVILTMSGVQLHYFPVAASVLTGYLVISAVVYIMHYLAKIMRLKTLHRGLGVIYLVLKVFLLVLIEIGLFPVVCGCWLDLCSLKLFSSAYSSRIAAFSSAPVASVFLHWMIGMVYVFYSASFVILLREILRPGVLWFMRNLNDPEFNPIQEMIDFGVQRHLRRLGASMILFFFAIMLVVFVPLQIIDAWLPGILPYNMSVTAETPLSELSVELLILQVVLPALLEQTQARTLIKAAVRKWCEIVGAAFELDKYLLGEDPEGVAADHQARQQEAADAAAAVVAGGGLAAEHQALLLVRDPAAPPHPYVRPSYFTVRIVLLLAALAATTVISSLLCFVLPVFLGRTVIRFASGHSNVHELYTAATGFYIIWMAVRGIMMVAEWMPQGARRVGVAALDVLLVVVKLIVVAIPLLIVIPTLLGVFFQLVVLAPIRVSYGQTPLLFPWQDWAMGILHTKIVGAAIMMGPDWWMKAAFDQIYNNGVMGVRVTPIYRDVVIPVLLFTLLLISWPYIGAKLLIFALGLGHEQSVVLLRLAYPCVLVILSISIFLYWQYARLLALAERIRNEKYLVGTQLVNYDRNAEKEKAAATAAVAALPPAPEVAPVHADADEHHEAAVPPPPAHDPLAEQLIVDVEV